MKKKIQFLLFIGLFYGTISFAQLTIKGAVTDKEDNSPLPGVTVVIENTTRGTITDFDGNYEIQVDSLGQTLVFTFVGMETQKAIVSGATLNLGLSAGMELEELVVTALGISKEKKALGYATQELKGDALDKVKYNNVVNSISGKVAGAQVKQSGNFGGSTNIVIRGTTSINGNNQALFVVDGVPIDNSNVNGASQTSGGNGYDYGNAVSDINPDDIESMNVLKGAAATALYGERAANGVIMITTKKGTSQNGIGVSLSSNYTFGKVNKNTFVDYQQQYGAGYGSIASSTTLGHPSLSEVDIDGDGTLDLAVPFHDDASRGEKFDPNLNVFQYDALVPTSPTYNKATPWVAAGDEGPISFFETAHSYTNSVSLNGGNEKTTFRLSYRNLTQTGILPNSKLERNNVSFSSKHQATDKLNVGISANYVNTKAKGRNSTGYNGNMMGNYRQWWQTNASVTDQKTFYDQTGQNVTWNPRTTTHQSTDPIFWDNPYWQRYENYQNDVRDRVYGNVTANYKLTDDFNALLRFTLDNYSQIQEERKAVGSVSQRFGVAGVAQPSGYSRTNRNYNENNVDLILTYNKDLTSDLNLNVLGGYNYRVNSTNAIAASTNGGLIIPDLYALTNSIDLNNNESATHTALAGVYGGLTFGYKRYLFLDLTARNDWSSTLPVGNRSYFYPATSVSFVFSELIDVPAISFGKARLNYAQVGKGAPFGVSGNDLYKINQSFTSSLSSLNTRQNNTSLRPEITTSIEAGLEMYFLNRRVGFDLAVYQTESKDQIVPVPVSTVTGYTSKYLNAGDIRNEGIEITLNWKVLDKSKLKWNMSLNFAKNRNKVVKLAEGIDNLQLANFQGGVSVNARVGEAYGSIYGTDYAYAPDGSKMIDTSGHYMFSESNNVVIGNTTPDFNGGLTNSFQYKEWSMSFLIDFQKGGDVFSLDQYYGQSTGLYKSTVGNNDLGNPVRDPLLVTQTQVGNTEEGLVSKYDSDTRSGGMVHQGTVKNPVTGEYSPNTRRVEGNSASSGGYNEYPNSEFIYDASYIKLRELSISYDIPAAIFSKMFISNATMSFVGSNLWILYKNIPDADPEAGLSSGNVQGFQSGVMPTTRNFGFNLKVNF